MAREYSEYQKKIIRRFYDNRDNIDLAKLGELATDLYLAAGKKMDRLWKQAGEVMGRLNVPASRIEHVLKSADPAQLAEIVNDIQKGLILPAEKPKSSAPKPSSTAE